MARLLIRRGPDRWAWVQYIGNTSIRKLFYRAYEAQRTGAKSFFVYDFRYKRGIVQGLWITAEERDKIPTVSINGVPKEEFPLHINLVMEKKPVTTKTPANPKQLYGDKKPSLGILPLSAQLAWWEAQQDGANKYGLYNWRTNPVEAQTYIEAALRHLQLYANGEENARDTAVQNLGAVMACCAILIDAAANNALIDNRIKSPENCDLLHKAEAMVKHLREAQAERDLAKKQAENKTAEHPWVYNTGAFPYLAGYNKIEVSITDEYGYDAGTCVVNVTGGKIFEPLKWSNVRKWRRYDG